MIDIEVLTAVLKELGYLDESEENDEKIEEHAKDKPTSRPEQKEHDDGDRQV